MTVVVSTAKCICSPYSAYIGVGNVVPTMMAAKAYASMPNARRVFVLVSGTLNNSDPGWGLIPPPASGATRTVQCAATAFSAPTPVSARTSNSALISGSPRSADVRVPTMPRMKASGIDTMPGLASGNQAKSACGSIAVLAPDNAGEKTISTIVETSPPYILHSAPRVLNRDQYSEYRIVGRFAAAATAKA